MNKKQFEAIKEVAQFASTWGKQNTFFIADLMKVIDAVSEREEITGDTSDGYHTFNELYEQRSLLWAFVCSKTKKAWKTSIHSDGTGYAGWFLAGINYGAGDQMTFHVENKYWDMFNCKHLEKAPEFDGHSVKDVIARLKKRLLQSGEQGENNPQQGNGI